MKNQYTRDIGDYGKYGLLRSLAKRGVNNGINWHFTQNDDPSDGKFTGYLRNPEEKSLDAELFDILEKIASHLDKTVQMIEDANTIANAVFYREVLRSVEISDVCICPKTIHQRFGCCIH